MQIDPRRAAITFTEFYHLPPSDYYWLLPEKFLGNKVLITVSIVLNNVTLHTFAA